MNVVPEPASRVFMADSLIGLRSLKFKCYPSGDPNHRKMDCDARVCHGSSALPAHLAVLVVRLWQDTGGDEERTTPPKIKQNKA